jgi:hypothetical protein
MYHVDLEGNMIFEKLNFKEERIDLLVNPLLGPLLRRKQQLLEDDFMQKKANLMAIYYLNLHKRYDLDVCTYPIIIYIFRTTYITNQYQ